VDPTSSYSSDVLSYNVPIFDHLRQHGPTLWRSTQFHGEALAADPQCRVFYPPMLLYAFVDMPLAHHLYMLFHQLVLAGGMWVYLRGQRRSPLAAFAGAAMV